jgi:hypothetical protein
MNEDNMQDEILNELKEITQKLSKILLGNGEPGLCEKVRTIEDKLKEEKEKPDVIGKWTVRIIGIVLALGQIYLIIKGLK